LLLQGNNTEHIIQSAHTHSNELLLRSRILIQYMRISMLCHKHAQCSSLAVLFGTQIFLHLCCEELTQALILSIVLLLRCECSDRPFKLYRSRDYVRCLLPLCRHTANTLGVQGTENGCIISIRDS
jgi:hypothetical protein